MRARDAVDKQFVGFNCPKIRCTLYISKELYFVTNIFLTSEIRGREFAKILRSLEQFIQKVPILFSNYNCSNLLNLRNLLEQVKSKHSVTKKCSDLSLFE